MCSVIGNMIIGNNSMAGLHVEIYKQHKKVLYLNVFSWGLLLNNGEKNTVVLNNRRHLLMISHKQRNTAEFLRRIYPSFRVAGWPPWNLIILHKETPQEKIYICKEARPHRPSCEYLADSARTSARCLQETKFHSARVSTSIKKKLNASRPSSEHPTQGEMFV